MNTDYPKIKVSDALQKASGNQAKLGRLLGYKRAYVNEWVRTNREYLPEVAAYRFVSQFGASEKVA